MIVFVMSDDPTDVGMRKLEDVVFKNETLAIGAKFFDTIKISEAQAAQDRILANAGRGAPRIIFLARDYSVSKVISPKSLSARKIITAMKRVVKKTYANSFDKMTKGYIKLLTRRDGLESVRQRIADKRARLNDRPNPSALKKLERDQKAYDEDMAKWQEDERKLLELQLTGDKKTQA
jgi:hypothetical protein